MNGIVCIFGMDLDSLNHHAQPSRTSFARQGQAAGGGCRFLKMRDLECPF
jgi:hypothetical protein